MIKKLRKLYSKYYKMAWKSKEGFLLLINSC